MLYSKTLSKALLVDILVNIALEYRIPALSKYLVSSPNLRQRYIHRMSCIRMIFQDLVDNTQQYKISSLMLVKHT